MEPQLVINHFAVVVCALVGMPVGYLWFGPLFGKAWAVAMDMDVNEQPGGAAMARSLLIYFVGSLLLAFVLAHSIDVWRASVWNAGEDAADWVYGLNGAFWPWLGFFLPLQMGRVAWERRGWKLVLINSSFDFTRLFVFSMILSHWR